MTPIVLDFETFGILPRPDYPPKPVSFSLQMPGQRVPKFYAWGHVTGGNNCTLGEATKALKTAYDLVSAKNPLLCQNGKFDMDVAETYFGVRFPHWEEFQDTMFLLFLDDPHSKQLGLKPSAERYLGMPPEEQDKVKDWVLAHKKQLENDYPEIIDLYGGIKPSNTGAFIAYAPGNIVGPYCNGDVTRTLKLFNLLYKKVCVDRGMKEAYERELRLLPILLANEREGIHVDTKAMERDQVTFEAAQAKTDAWLRKALKAPGLDFNKDAEVANALKKADAITEWTQTATGRDSVSKKNLKISHFRNKKVAAAYSYRQKCATNLETFIRPWQKFGTGGQMSTNWKQVSQSSGGTRTGRPSTSTPNFLNMPRQVEDSETRGFIMPTHIDGLPELPRIRSYILPDDKSHLIGRRDFNQQELRVLAHFEDGLLMQAYLKDPTLDVHEFCRMKIQELTGLDVGRYFTKTLNFGFLYGMGLGALAEDLQKTVEEVKKVRAAQMAALPGLKEVDQTVKKIAKSGDFVVTWGGRQYYREPSMMIGNRMVDFSYKLLNYLIQGSSADITKEALIRYDAAKKHGRMILSVYDEIDISCPKDKIKEEMLLLREVMLGIELDVPLLSDGEVGKNLGTLTDLKEPKFDLSRWSAK